MSAHFREAWRAVAVAKLDEFSYQCCRLADIVYEGAVDRSEAADTLQSIAIANSLDCTFGQDYIAALIADAFAPVIAEAAE